MPVKMVDLNPTGEERRGNRLVPVTIAGCFLLAEQEQGLSLVLNEPAQPGLLDARITASKEIAHPAVAGAVVRLQRRVAVVASPRAWHRAHINERGLKMGHERIEFGQRQS